ncbi:hypothetical protein LGT39_03940 [Demequina sp. TTPB684]|uniref:hypothetical protein n=1 Tax=unclassified Demequina TaxID=2620311 RepID=UPI001CF55873|nr:MULTISPECIES: hypothetical protein [unclassified Demequina]MCB2411999.1 hypothetical protein [Demequina sp. TTPB684]UPU88070.1 hypothetical protein LGT36_012600 [Demequina sp. TMPB413]
MGESPMRQALRWLAHPVSLVALAVMALNDHVLKEAFSSWWTGKLSDVAGLVFFPALLGVLLAGAAQVASVRGRVRSEAASAARLPVVAVAVTAVGFAWVKATPSGASAASDLLTAVAGHSVVRMDVTDLLALPALGLALWASGKRSATPGGAHGSEPDQRALRRRRAVGAAVFPLAVLASVATGATPPHAVVIHDGTDAWAVGPGQCDVAPCGPYVMEEGEWVDAPSFEADGRQREMCSPDEPNRCLRTVPGRLAVEETRDAGATWTDAWAAGEDDVKALRDAYALPPDEPLEATGVAFVGPDEAGTTDIEAVATLGRDGLLVLSKGGSWERRGFADLECCSAWPLAALPTRWMPYGALVPPAVAWAIAAMASTSALMLALARRRLVSREEHTPSPRVRHATWWAGGTGASAAMAAIASGPLGFNGSVYSDQWMVHQALSVVSLCAAVPLAVIAFSVAGGWTRRLRWRLALLATGAAVVVGALVYVVPGDGWADALVGLVTGLAGAVAGSRLLAHVAVAWGLSPFPSKPVPAEPPAQPPA